MNIEHIAVWTKDIDNLCRFYERYFQAQISVKYNNPKKKFTSCFLSFESGARIEVMHMDSVLTSANDTESNYWGLAHFSISVGSKDKVDRLVQELQRDGYPLIDGPRTTGDGYYEALVLDPDGNRLEITV